MLRWFVFIFFVKRGFGEGVRFGRGLGFFFERVFV